jgi:uncharacterized protein YndB with AHSA1/START domain
MERTIELPASIDEVWDALTTPARLSEWFGATALEVDPRPGGRVTFERDGERWRGLVEVADRPTLFAFRWLPVGPLARTRVEFRLEDLGDRTRLTVRETPAWEALDQVMEGAR